MSQELSQQEMQQIAFDLFYDSIKKGFLAGEADGTLNVRRYKAYLINKFTSHVGRDDPIFARGVTFFEQIIDDVITNELTQTAPIKLPTKKPT